MDKIKKVLEFVLKVCNILLLYIPRLLSLLTPKGKERQIERKKARIIKRNIRKDIKRAKFESLPEAK